MSISINDYHVLIEAIDFAMCVSGFYKSDYSKAEESLKDTFSVSERKQFYSIIEQCDDLAMIIYITTVFQMSTCSQGIRLFCDELQACRNEFYTKNVLGEFLYNDIVENIFAFIH